MGDQEMTMLEWITLLILVLGLLFVQFIIHLDKKKYNKFLEDLYKDR